MTKLLRTTVLALAVITLAQPGCGSSGTNTQVMVTTDAQPGVRSMARTLIVRVYGGIVGESLPSLLALEHPFDVSPETGRWPREVALTPRDRGPNRIYRFEAAAYAEANPTEASEPIAVVRLISGYASGQTLHVRLVLQDSCIDVDCDAEQTCDRGACVDAHVPVDQLQRDAGAPGMDAEVPMDGDTADTGMRDGGTGDGGGVCDPAMCDDGYSCTDDFCNTDGTCGHTPHDDRCVDTNVCTDDICTGGGAGVEAVTGCLRRAVSVGCDDGVFCNGTDTCSGGVCTHSMDRCTAPLVCNETTDACDGCGTTADCPPTSDTPWGTCEGFSDTCDATGTQTATRISYACTGGSCVSTMTPLSQSCTRPSRDGTTCGSPSFGDWSSCDWESDCDELASQARTRIEYRCMGGGCGPQTFGESMPCTRETDTMICSDGDPCSGPDRCTGGSCASGPPICATDGGSPGCTMPSQCDDGVSCTVEACSAGICSNTPSDALCMPPMACATGYCDPIFDCQFDYSGCSGGCTSDADCASADPCSIGVCNMFVVPHYCEYYPSGDCSDGGVITIPDGGPPPFGMDGGTGSRG